MLDATSKVVAAQTTYSIPANTMTVDDGTSDGRIRPTSVTVAEKDGTIETFAFHGPRQARPTDSWVGDSRDNGRTVIQLNELDLDDETEALLNEVMMLHLRSTVHVLTEDETREVLAQHVK